MDWDDLRFVLAIQREGTLTDAATALGVTRTTVGRRLKEAERRLGVRLFDRTPEGFTATAAGEELAETAARIEGEVLSTEGRILGRDAELRGRLRVSALEYVFGGFVEIFASFCQRYPGVDLTVSASEEYESLVRREVDVALRLGNAPAEHLVGRRVGRMHFEVYAARSLVERVGEGAPLAEYPWLHWDEREDARWLDRWLHEHAPGARISLRASAYSVRREAIAAGLGVHFLPCFDGDADPSLVGLGARLDEHARDLWLLTLPDLQHTSRIRAFMDHAFEGFKRNQHRLVGTRAGG